VLEPKTPIVATDKMIRVSGKVFYNDRRRRIDIKRPIRDLFESGKLKVGYVMEMCLNPVKALKRVKELSKKHVVPVLLYFVKEDEEDEK